MLAALRRISLTGWIVIGMLAGVLLGWLAPDFAAQLKPLSTVFLRAIKSVVVPIIFGTLVIGIAGHGDDLKQVGRMAVKSIAYFWAMTAIALVIGLLAGNLSQPGIGVTLPPPDPHAPLPKPAPTTFGGFLEHVVPQSFFDAAAHNEVLQVVFWATLFGIALAQVKGRPKQAMLDLCEGLAEVMFKFVAIVMKYAPVGIGAAMAVTVSHSGIGVLLNLGKLVLTLYAALIVFALVALLPAALLARLPLRRFVRAVKEPAIIAFTTTSSDAALPLAMQRMVEFGVPKRIVAFVMPTGYSFNLDGSTLYLGVASLFVAQAAGVDLTIGQQVLMMLTLLVTSKGIAAVPRASLVVLAGTLHAFGLPIEGIAVILGVDEFMDMARTMVNLVGNCLATAVVGRWEGALQVEPELAPAPAAAPARALEPGRETA
ncbi:MAG TPA: cation:dicarboxylase symporter family transporter [Gemmatimonadales bacterium]|nr:cation:dicarboxylase symporter family transporter [Gemmatimonadales bacterium]